MPIIHFFGGRLDRSQKEIMVREFARAASQATGLPEEKIITVVHATEPEDVAVGGTLLR